MHGNKKRHNVVHGHDGFNSIESRGGGQDMRLKFRDVAGTISCTGGRGNAKWIAVHELFHALGKIKLHSLKCNQVNMFFKPI